VVKKIQAPIRGRIPLSASDIASLRNDFYSVTEQSKGTAYGAFHGFPMGQIEVAGKTGTAELPNTNQNDSWFVSFGGPTGQTPQYVTVIEVYKSNQGALSAAPFVRDIWNDLYGVSGAKAIFPNGVPPAKLPKINSRGNLPVKHKPTPTTSTSTSPGTTPPASTTSALGPPDAVEPRRISYSGGSP
jgi:penicillin-binding protein 2